MRVGRSARSPALVADGRHIFTDVVTSLGVIAGLVGAMSDRTGRRVVYVYGLVFMSVSFFIYPLAGSGIELIVYRIVLAVGMTAATVMMSTCFAEYSQDVSRGRWMGMVGVFNGLGVVLMAITPKLVGQSYRSAT